MEEQQTHVREQAGADFKASQEFDDILKTEYDASFPNTYMMCWENVVTEIRKTISQITWKAFPVPLNVGGGVPQESSTQSSTPLKDDLDPLFSQRADSPTLFTFPSEEDKGDAPQAFQDLLLALRGFIFCFFRLYAPFVGYTFR